MKDTIHKMRVANAAFRTYLGWVESRGGYFVGPQCQSAPWTILQQSNLLQLPINAQVIKFKLIVNFMQLK